MWKKQVNNLTRSTSIKFMNTTMEVVLSIVSGAGMIVTSVIGYFLKRTMEKNDETSKLASSTKTELEVLKMDHTNKHAYISEKFDDLKDSIKSLTNEIVKLTDKIKD